jgi:hypothetical protein
MAGVHTIDKLPAAKRQQVIDALVEVHQLGKEPDYRGLIDKLKLKCSHISLWRYDTKQVKPALKRNLERVLATNPAESATGSSDSLPARIESRELAESETKQRLMDDPIVRAVIAKRDRLDRAIQKTLDNDQLDTYAKLESVDLKAIEMHAKAMQHPGFTAAAPAQAGGTTVVVVMPTANDARMAAWQQRQGAIDVDVVE